MRTIFLLRVGAVLAALSTAWLPSAAWANGCSSSSSHDSICPLGTTGTGLLSSTLPPSTIAPALAISGMLSNNTSGRSGAGGLQRTALNSSSETGMAAAGGSTRWSIWGGLGQNNVGYSFEPVRSSGRVSMVLAGIDYTFSNNVIAGVSYTDDSTRVGTQFNNGSLNGSGYTIAPYVAVPFGRNWVFDASAGWGRNKLSQIDNVTAGVTITGNAIDSRSFASLALSYAGKIGKLDWVGKGTYLAAEDKIGQFTQSNNVAVPASTTRLAQLRVGGQLSYDAGGWAPYAGLTYIYDVQRAAQPVVAGRIPANDRDAWQIALGATIYSKGQLSGGIQFTDDLNRKEVKNTALMANVAYRF